ncbi:hypothetical protein [Actibacterium ureilyticum]|uniref:hypothetical protein n=1 Tax=Actibacterium ureilyticum TaxID=1590614 RepID=UPI000BAAFE29|nr:hypothetical protein [Actibacterium ureilyticum]
MFCTTFRIAAAGILAASAVAAKDRTELSASGFTIWAPSAISCKSPPEFTLEGPAVVLFSDDRKAVVDLVARMAGGLGKSCPDIDALTVKGSFRGIDFSFDVTRDRDWRLDPATPAPKSADTPVAAVTEPAVAPQPVAAKTAPAKTAEAAAPAKPAEPVVPERPKVAPGLSFEQFTPLFGSVASVRGHFALGNDRIWQRVLAARAYAERPQMLNDDQMAMALVEQMLTPAEHQQLMGPYAGKHLSQLSVFERRDLANRIRTQLKPGLDQRRQTGPIKVYHSVPVQLGEYSFETGAFPLNASGLRNHPGAQWNAVSLRNAFDSIVLPSELKTSVEQARQLDAYLRSRNDTRLYMAVFAEIDPELPPSIKQSYGNSRPGMHTQLVQIALFADQGLSQVLYDFTPVLKARQQQADKAALYLGQPISGGEDFVRAVNAINGNEAAAKALADAYALGQPNPDARRAEAFAALGETKGPRMMSFRGTLRIGTYDPVRKVMPLQGLNAQYQQFDALQLGFNMRNTFFPNLTELKMTPAEAAQFTQAAQNNGNFEFRLSAEMVAGNFQNVNQNYLELIATHRPVRIQVFSGRNGEAAAERTILLDAELPSADAAVPSLIDALRLDK